MQIKEIIIVGVVAFICTAWVADSGAPPQAVPIGIKGVTTSMPAGGKKGDEQIGDFKITGQSRQVKIRTQVYDDNDPKAEGNRNDSDFPLSGGTAN